jgi:membrane fusion protein, copper/silver efflux system
MNTNVQKHAAIVISALILAVVAATAGYWFARRGVEYSAMAPSAKTTGQERRPLYWYDPMVPTQHFDAPGKSPFMHMQLIPKYTDAQDIETAGVKIDPGTRQNLGVRLTTVERGSLAQLTEAVGALGFNQRDMAVIQARSGGFVTRVYARAPGDVIARNDPIADLLVPEWTGAQTEFLALLNSNDHALIDAARERMLLLGMSGDLVTSIERSRESRATVTIRSPLAGVIETLDVREGMTISIGATLAKVNGLAAVWLEAAIPEARGGLVSLGKQVKARFTAYPGESFVGRVIAVLPQANAETRTLRVRIELPNRGGLLKPGMFGQVRLDGPQTEPVLYVASEAIIHTGTRTIAIVAAEQGRFIPAVVQTGEDVDGETVILDGLKEGQRVVSSGQFLIDSEANLQGVLARLDAGGTDGGPADTEPGSRP